MQTEFFLLNASFECPNPMEIEMIEEAIQGMSRDYDYIKKHHDKVSKHESIYDVALYENYQVADLYGKKGLFSRDTKKFLLKIIDHSEETSWSNEEAFALIAEQEKEDLCETKVNYGLLALFRVRDKIPESYTVYNQRDWLTFHREFLSKFPCEPSYFIAECRKYFPNLYFHERNEKTVGRILKDCPKKIIYYLSCVNDIFLECKNEPYQRMDTIRLFNTRCRFDIPASIEGDLARKKDLSFELERESIYCELHMKLLGDDKNKISQNRIYFHEGKRDIHNGKILIGHIGEHL